MRVRSSMTAQGHGWARGLATVGVRVLGQRAVAGALVLGLSPGCAQIVTRSSVEVVPRHDAAALVLGPGGGEITSRGVKAGWTQDGDRLAVRIEESRTCNAVRHVPVTRIERVDRRTAGGAMWIEYGIGGAALATGLVGLIRPEWFSQATVITEDGRTLEDKRSGYRIGGILTGIGALLLTAAVIDTVRTRDEVRSVDAYRREEGGVVECLDPLAPMQGQTVELLVGKWSSVEPTGDEGDARFLLPPVEDLPEDARTVIEATARWDAAKAEADAAAAKAAEEEAARRAAEEAAAAKKGRRGKAGKPPAGGEAAGGGASGAATGESAGAAAAGEPAAELGPRPEPVVVRGVLRLDDKRALAVSFVVPYTADRAKGHEGQGMIDAEVGGKAPPRGKGLSLQAGGEGDVGADAREPEGGAKAASGDPGTRGTEGGADAKKKSDDASPRGTEGGADAKKKSDAASTQGAKDGATLKLGGSGGGR